MENGERWNKCLKSYSSDRCVDLYVELTVAPIASRCFRQKKLTKLYNCIASLENVTNKIL